MTVTYGFYDSVSGDRRYNAAQMSALFNGIITEGIFQSIGTAFVVVASTGMVVNIGIGRAWLKETWTNSDTVLPLTVLASEISLPRIDTVVIEVNKEVATRANTIKIIKGTPATVPVAPTMVNTANIQQFPLANIAVAAGVTTINAGNITNRIGVAGGTPFITGVLTAINSALLLAQWEAEFDQWLANYSNQLDASQATNLQNQINALVSGWVTPPVTTWTYFSADAPTFTFKIAGDQTAWMKVGRKIKLTQTTVKYFVATNVVYTAPDTIVTVYGGTDYVLANAEITLPSYSLMRTPDGFPMERSKWTVKVSYTATATQTPVVANTVYNPLSQQISLPIGQWRVWWEAAVQAVATMGGSPSNLGFQASLSSSATAHSDSELQASYTFTMPASVVATGRGTVHREKLLTMSVKTPYYLVISTGGSADSLSFVAASAHCVVAAECTLI